MSAPLPPPLQDRIYRISLDNVQVKDNNYIHLPNDSNIPSYIQVTSLNLSVKTSETAVFMLELYSTVEQITTRTPIAHNQVLSYGGYNTFIYNIRDLDIYCATYPPDRMKPEFRLAFSILSYSPLKPTFAVSGSIHGIVTFKPIQFSGINQRLG